MKYIIMLFAMVVMPFNGSIAQNEITIPKFTKLIQLVNNVNLRKEPNTNCPKLLLRTKYFKEQDGWIKGYSHEGYCWQEKNDGYEYVPARADYLLVLDESDEWYHGLALLENYTPVVEVYVSKKAAKTKVPKKITSAYISITEDAESFVRTSGRYKDYVIITGGDSSLQSSDEYIFIGKNVGGVCFGKLFDSTPVERTGCAKIPSWVDLKNINNLTDNQIQNLLNTSSQSTVILTTGIVLSYYPKGSLEVDGFNAFVID